MTDVMETPSISHSWTREGTVIAATVSTCVFPAVPRSIGFLMASLMERASISRPEQVPGELSVEAANRLAGLRGVRGKYAFVRTSSLDFARRKHGEIKLEG